MRFDLRKLTCSFKLKQPGISISRVRLLFSRSTTQGNALIGALIEMKKNSLIVIALPPNFVFLTFNTWLVLNLDLDLFI